MKVLIWVGVAGALGALARTLIGILIPAANGFPVGTFVANMAGTFILCFLVERTLRETLVNKTTYDAITVGFLGSFTTFSALSMETMTLLQSNVGMAMLYVGVSLLIGLFVGALGFQLGGKGQEG
ncbi:fluoride efflux transporter FluC [Sporosarcina sp. A2]|uniref:fluoride efflux transporter FluC n=1 Tax=Sporosarcina sp. A2 TaxID=3393449 RepID=UPI003D7A09F0